jgi:hypothetical protein
VPVSRLMVSGPYSGGITLGGEVVCLPDGWRSRWACRAVARTGMPSARAGSVTLLSGGPVWRLGGVAFALPGG